MRPTSLLLITLSALSAFVSTPGFAKANVHSCEDMNGLYVNVVQIPNTLQQIPEIPDLKSYGNFRKETRFNGQQDLYSACHFDQQRNTLFYVFISDTKIKGQEHYSMQLNSAKLSEEGKLPSEVKSERLVLGKQSHPWSYNRMKREISNISIN
jgi:hypothetical protein